MHHIKHLVLVLSSFLLFSCSKNHSVRISGVIENIDDIEVLISFFSLDSLVVDTVSTKQDGSFTYSNDVVTDLTSFALYFNNQSFYISVFASPGDKVKIKGDASSPELIVIRGNEINNDITSFKQEHQDLLENRTLLRNNLRQRLDSIDSASLLSIKEEVSKITIINNDLLQYAEEFIEDNSDKMSSLILVNELFTSSDNEKALERIRELLSPELLKTKMGLNFESYLKKIKRSAEGAVMPFFEIDDIEGEKISSYDYRGKQLLLSFITPEKQASQIALGILKDLYEKIDKDSVEFLSVYIDTSKQIDTIYKQDSLKWNYHIAEHSWASDMVNNYNVESVPAIFLISPDGVISERNLSLLSVEEKLKMK